MVTMLRLGKSAGPCTLCNATGLVSVWDHEGEFEPCEYCKGSGYNNENLIVIQRESKKTKFAYKCLILSEAYFAYEDEEDMPSWVEEYCNPYLYDEKVTPGIYLARMYLNEQAFKERAKPFVDMAFNHLLEHYQWRVDMGFKELSEIVEGGQYWSEADADGV